jgi:NTE family protein
MRRRLAHLLDLGRLNNGDIRLTIAATDARSGDPVFFDSSKERIEFDHLFASCGFLPEFAPVTIGTQMLVDGGLSWKAPFDPILNARRPAAVSSICTPATTSPRRASKLLMSARTICFGNQTYLRLKDKLTIRRLELKLAGTAVDDEVNLLSYHAGAAEPGPEKSFNFSRRALARRWRASFDDMSAALLPDGAAVEGLRVVRRGAMAAAMAAAS